MPPKRGRGLETSGPPASHPSGGRGQGSGRGRGASSFEGPPSGGRGQGSDRGRGASSFEGSPSGGRGQGSDRGRGASSFEGSPSGGRGQGSGRGRGPHARPPSYPSAGEHSQVGSRRSRAHSQLLRKSTWLAHCTQGLTDLKSEQHICS